jgi:sporulation-control protein spo0M
VLVELDRRARSVGGFLESAMEMNERFDVCG